MNETLDYIESYFENGLNAEERRQFEQRITTDAAFAGEVAFYLQTRQALRQELLRQKEKSWQTAPEAVAVKPAPVVAMKKPSPVRRWMAVAAGVTVSVGIYLTFFMGGGGGAMKLAKNAADEPLSGLMGSSSDSIQMGVTAYKQQDFSKAESYFVPYYAVHSDKVKALEFAGFVSLQQKEYDEAISRFRELAQQSGLAANPGLYYQAVALILRNDKNDAAEAKKLLEQVVQNDLDKSTEAQKLLDKL